MKFVLLCLFLSVSQALGDKAIELKDLQGNTLTPLISRDQSPSVVVFITVDCPVANAYIPELKRLREYFRQKGVQLTLVHVDPDLSTEDARAHAKEYGIEIPVVIDRDHQLVAATKAEVTPEAVVLTGNGKISYKGRINNLYADYGDRRRKATVHDVRDAVDAALAGKPASKSYEEPIGCFIEPLD